MPRLALGDPAPAFRLPGVDGSEHALADYEGMPVAVVFSCCHCPYVRAWEGRLNDIARNYEGRAAVVAVNANDHLGDSFDDMRARCDEQGFVFPFLRDESQEVAAAYGAARTPEVFALDGDHRLVYHGAPDSDYTDPNGAEPYLRRALDAALDGEQPAVFETPAVGCTIKWRAA
ncbi:MAG TPA: thioredoxin family protein [Gaiellaceae bacterium]